MRNLFLAASALALAVPSVANAAFIVTFPAGSLASIPGSVPTNDFSAQLNALGLAAFASAGATISLSAADTVIFEYMGSESGAVNTFSAMGIAAFAETNANNFATGPGATNAPTAIGQAAFAAGAFTASFFVNGAGPAIAVGNAQFGILVPTVNTTSPYISDVLYFAFDDGLAIDDNHDDHIVRARLQSAVPEPSTWALMLGGFGIVGSLMRRRNVTTRVSFA